MHGQPNITYYGILLYYLVIYRDGFYKNPFGISVALADRYITLLFTVLAEQDNHRTFEALKTGAVVTIICTNDYNIYELYILHTLYIYVFHVILSINSDYFPIHIHCFDFVMEITLVGTEV
jgi:hypothetical protein